MADNHNKIGIALSGGGIRAMAFHCGVLRLLAENNKLEGISHISSVSGGSLFTGLVFSINNMEWPSSEEYLSHIEPTVRKLLTSTNLQLSAMPKLLYLANWKYLFSRANVISKTLQDVWKVTGHLTDLPEDPVWSVNGTTAETGRRFRFKRTECGDYELGYADAKQFSISDAMAVSAAFPIGIGPLAINTNEFSWEKRPSWNDTPEKRIPITPGFKKIHIYDGGIYDNLGIEPLFDIGKRKLKGEIDYLIVSDAGAPLKRTSFEFVLNPFRAKRIADIALDQTRALRIRGFVNYLMDNPGSGLYLQIGADPKKKIEENKTINENIALELLKDNWLTNVQCQTAASYPTDLKKLLSDDFELLSEHGYETAKWNASLF